MKREQNFSMEYRPDSYWDTPDAIHANIKGEFRRKALHSAALSDELEDLPSHIFADDLSDEMRKVTASLHPALMGGEDLPGYQDKEVEIARVSLASVTADVVSIRATPTPDGIHYRVVDEYENHYYLEYDQSEVPLTLRELVHLMETVTCEEMESTGLVRHHWDFRFGNSAAAIDAAIAFTSVSSAYYPDLEDWWESEAQTWAQKIQLEIEAEDNP